MISIPEIMVRNFFFLTPEIARFYVDYRYNQFFCSSDIDLVTLTQTSLYLVEMHLFRTTELVKKDIKSITIHKFNMLHY